MYIQLYGRLPPGMEPEVLTWRLRVAGPRPVMVAGGGVSAGGSARKGRRPIWSEERRSFVEADIWDRYRLLPGDVLRGPAIVEERESSAVIGAGGRGIVDERGNLKVTL